MQRPLDGQRRASDDFPNLQITSARQPSELHQLASNGSAISDAHRRASGGRVSVASARRPSGASQRVSDSNSTVQINSTRRHSDPDRRAPDVRAAPAGFCDPRHVGDKRKGGVNMESILGLFKAWDANGDGFISKLELRRLMRFVTDGAITDEMIDRLMEAADLNSNGVIEVEEFVTWIFDPKTGMTSRDVQPSKIDVSTSPIIMDALKNWFAVLDMNNNGIIEYEEFAVARLLLRGTHRDPTAANINDDFAVFDHDKSRKISKEEFFDEHIRMLNAIPRPIEEKAELINSRRKKLENAAKAAAFDGRTRKGMDIGHFLDLAKSKYGSLEQAFIAMDTDSSGTVDIVQLVSTVEQLLELEQGSVASPLMVRALFHELDPKCTGGISLSQLQDAEKVVASKARSTKNYENKFVALKDVSPAQQAIDEGLSKKGDLNDMIKMVLVLWKKHAPDPRGKDGLSYHLATDSGQSSARRTSAEQRMRKPSKQTAKETSVEQKATETSVEQSASPAQSAICSHETKVGHRVSSLSPEPEPIRRVDRNKKKRASTNSGGVLGLGFVNSKRLTLIEFESVVCACLRHLPMFQEHLRQHGVKIAVRIHLQGWTVKQMFDCMDANGDGHVSLEEWITWTDNASDGESAAAGSPNLALSAVPQ